MTQPEHSTKKRRGCKIMTDKRPREVQTKKCVSRNRLN